MASPASSAPRPTEPAAAEGQHAPTTPGTAARVESEVIAVTTSDEFLLELGEVLGGKASMRPVESIDGALEHLGDSRRTQLIAFDIRGVVDVRQAIERARSRVPGIVVLAFADSAAEPSTGSNLQGSDLHALLPIPVDRRKTAAAIESAIAAAEKRGRTRTQAPARIDISVAEPGPAARTVRRLPPLALAAGGVALVLALAVGGWLLMRQSEDAVAEAPPALSAAPEKPPAIEVQTQPAEIPLAQGTLDELLEKARLAMRQRRFTEPAGDNALVYYRSAVALDASNAEAAQGLERIGGVLVARVEEAIAGNRMEEGVSALAAAKSAIPEDSRLTGLETRLVEAQIAAALAEGNFELAAGIARAAQRGGKVPADQVDRWRIDVARRQNEARVKRASELASERLREGRLVEPANDSAKFYVRQLRDLEPTGAATQRHAKDLAAAYLRKARESSLAGRASEAERWFGEARAAGIPPAEITAMQREIAASRQRAAAAESDRLVQLARERVKEGQLMEPANDSAAHYINALKETEESHSAIAALSRELAAKLLDRAESAAREGRATQVDTDLAAARRWGADAKTIQAVRDLAAATRAQASAARQVSLQKLLKRTRYVAPEYPERALEKSMSGSVTVEFTVDVQGEPRDLKVLASEPQGLFDKAALNAVRRWRYEPVIVDEVPVEIPTRTLIKFEAPKQ